MKKKDLEDIVVIQNIINGDKNSEILLYNRYKKIVTKYVATKYSGNAITFMEDNVSDIMVKVFLNLRKFDIKRSNFKNWVLNIAKNHMIDNWRLSKNPTVSIDNYMYGDPSFSNKSVESNYSSSASSSFENLNFINYISTKISDDEFNLINLKYIQGYSYKEMGKHLGTSATTALNKTNYIMGKLRKSMSNDPVTY